MAPVWIPLPVDTHIAVIATEGARLASAAASSDLDATIPTCPDWNMRDLVRHQGGVHRWASSIVGTPRRQPWNVDLTDVVGQWPPDNQLVRWFKDGYDELVSVLLDAPSDLDCFTFLAAPSPLAMWARRQAHETTIHRVDAEGAVGSLSGIDPDIASDGIDELLSCFVTRRPTPSPTGEIATIAVHTADTNDHWHLTVGQGPIVTRRKDAAADVIVRGTAHDVYLFVWNRLDASSVHVEGNRDIVEWWKDRIRIHWS